MARTEARMPVVAQADTDEFKVSSAKKFEGMLGTPLPPSPPDQSGD